MSMPYKSLFWSKTIFLFLKYLYMKRKTCQTAYAWRRYISNLGRRFSFYILYSKQIEAPFPANFIRLKSCAVFCCEFLYNKRADNIPPKLLTFP